MPDDFDDMLSGLARAVGESVQPPPGQGLRRRSARRLARRRITASVLAVGLVGLAGGTAAVLAPTRGGAGAPAASTTDNRATARPAPSPDWSVAPTSGARTAQVGTPGYTTVTIPGTRTPPATSSASSPASSSSSTSSGSSTIPLSELVGLWTPTDGEGRALVLLPNGDIGIGQAGGQYYPMCAGTLGTESDGSFPVSVACSDWGTSGLTLSVSGADLVLHVPADGSSPSTQIAWVRVSEPTRLPGDGTALPSWLIGKWAVTGHPTYETFDFSADGSTTWTMTTQLGQTLSGTATVTAVGNGQYIGRTTRDGQAELWVFAGLDNGHLSAIGAYGTVDFTRTSN